MISYVHSYIGVNIHTFEVLFMSLPHALLGLLSYVPSTGYEIKAIFDESIHFFWNATTPQIYRTLNQMEQKGWLTVNVVYQENKPNRKVYTVTEDGREELNRWLAESPEPQEIRFPFLIKVFLGRNIDPGVLKSNILIWRGYFVQLLKRYEEECPTLIEKYANLTGAIDDARYWGLTLDFGSRVARIIIEWCDATLATLGEEDSDEDNKSDEGNR